MCDVCNAEKMDSRFINGKKYRVFTRTLHTIFHNRIMQIQLCFVHDIELFNLGERRFVEAYPKYVIKAIESGKAGKARRSFGEELSNIAQLI